MFPGACVCGTLIGMIRNPELEHRMSVEDISVEQKNLRFAFGSNWTGFVRRNLNDDRIGVARRHMLDFLKRSDLKGMDFLDIGSGSGINSAAALSAGAGKICSFDFDPQSVGATSLVRHRAGNPSTWRVIRGDVLDDDFINSLGTWNFVYSWGVLHHTGEVWHALENASRTVAKGGLFYIALYSADVRPDADFWLAVKREYNLASRWKKQQMVWWYIWNHMMGRSIRRLPRFVSYVLKYRLARGMSAFVDIRDWLGGWPMEFVYDRDVISFLRDRRFTLANILTGAANTEFLFVREA